MNILRKYACLLIDYCLEIKSGDKLFVTTTTLAEPLLREVYREGIKRGAHVVTHMTFAGQGGILLNNGNEEQMTFVHPALAEALQTYDAYLVIRAPFNLREDQEVNKDNRRLRSEAMKPLNQVYFERTADRSLRRSLCQYPTQASAQEAGMSLEDYSEFVYNACKLYTEDPESEWKKVGERQQAIVDFLNAASDIRYVNKHMDVSFSTKGRTWINSDGKTNMPSGEVFTGPVEDSVEGSVYFDYPSIYRGHTVKGIRLEIKNGEVVSWSAEQGGDLLDEVFKIDGARFFGEVAIGTNYNVTRATKNILFDEKIGGTIHMAIGQSYKQSGGKNTSAIHWDMIADMSDGGAIYVDGSLVYKDGRFLEFEV